jgi:hypothetical protein
MKMPRFNGSAPVAKTYTIEQLELHTWFERDRSMVELRVADTNETVFEIWDDDCQQALNDGFLEQRNLKESAFSYARDLGLIS